jgi:hypothetical protein
MHSNLSPYLIDLMILDTERAARRPRRPAGPRRRFSGFGLLRRRPRAGRPGGRVAPA